MTRSSICIALGAALLALFWLASPAAAGECDDGVDNDGDGLTDLEDTGCASASDPSEWPDCDDGLDNDLDGLFDFPDDPGCRNRQPTSREDPECSDGVNNDPGDAQGQDLLIDCQDPQCWYQGLCQQWWDQEGRKRGAPAPITPGPPDPDLPPAGWGIEDVEGCGAVQTADYALLLPFLWLWRRGRRSRKA